MKIQNHKLVALEGESPIQFTPTNNKGGDLAPQLLIIHYTAGASTESSVEWFLNPTAQASAHVVIGMDGRITQLVPFNKVAWHAGISRWNGLSGLNKHSIGIELDNPGRLKKVGTQYQASFGRFYDASVVMEALHKHESTPSFWHIYTEAQLNACQQLASLLVANYKLKEVLGHEDIAPFRKSDPGPAFPLESFRAKVLGRVDDAGEIFKVNTESTNLRSGPGTDFESLAKLKKGSKVEFIGHYLNWCHVYVVNNTGSEKEGWIHNSLLTKA